MADQPRAVTRSVGEFTTALAEAVVIVMAVSLLSLGLRTGLVVLITIPVVTQSIVLSLPKETNIARQTKPQNIEISVNKDGDVFWNNQPVADSEALFQRLKTVATQNPQPEVHIRGDENARYESIGRVVFACQRAAIAKISFIAEPPPKG